MKTLTLLPAKNIITNIHQKIHLSTQLKSWILFIMLVAGLEPARTNCSTDFKSVASAYSAIPADCLQFHPIPLCSKSFQNFWRDVWRDMFRKNPVSFQKTL